MIDRSDWDTYSGPNEFFAGLDDRILHREIPEQEEAFWADFMEGRNGNGFAKIDCPENRELLLQKYAAFYGSSAPIVRSQLNEIWRRYVITYGASDAGFIDPNAVEEEQTVDPGAAEAARLAEYEAFSNDPETSTKMINERKRTDAGYARYFNERLQQEIRSDDPMQEINVRNNWRQPALSTKTSTSRRVAPTEVQQFAVQYARMSTEQLKTLLSPVLNPNGPADAARVKRLFDDACAYGLV
jgi:hypothetical protein